MRRAAHDKKEMMKSNLIKHEQLISDPKIREKVDKLREEREEKIKLKEESKKNKKLNVGLDNEMDVEKNDNNIKKQHKKIAKNEKTHEKIKY